MSSSASSSKTTQSVFRLPKQLFVRIKPSTQLPKKKRRPVPPEEQITVAQFLGRFDDFDEQKILKIRQFPQHLEGSGEANPLWLNARKHLLTGSRYGAAAGNNKYCRPEQLCADMLWNTFQGNQMTRYGNDHEDDAAGVYEQTTMVRLLQTDQDVSQFRVDYTGLNICMPHPWLGMSPDGVVYLPGGEVRLLEIKCPWSLRHRRAGDSRFYRQEKLQNGARGPIPKYYFDQIQGGMGLFNLNGVPMTSCDFVVWTSEETQITNIPFDQNYFENDLFPKLSTFYFDTYVPAAVRQANGKLDAGQIYETMKLDL